MKPEPELTPAQRRFIDSLEQKLPPVMARDRLDELLGGIISPSTVKGYDLKGKGPQSFRVGRGVAYPTRPFLVWLATFYKVTPIQGLDDLLTGADQTRPAA